MAPPTSQPVLAERPDHDQPPDRGRKNWNRGLPSVQLCAPPPPGSENKRVPHMPRLSTAVIRHAIEPCLREIGGDASGVDAIALDADSVLRCFFSAGPYAATPVAR